MKRGEKSMELKGKMIPCGSREAVVTVLSYRNGIMEGYLQHPRLAEKEKLQSLSQMILLLNSLVDLEDCPGGCLPLIPMEQEKDRSKSVFRIQVLFREHYSWQGRLIWQDEGWETVFRSVAELLQLFDEILGE